MYLEVQGCVLPFWKPLINIFKEPDCHGCWSALNICQAMLKYCIHFSTLMHTTVLQMLVVHPKSAHNITDETLQLYYQNTQSFGLIWDPPTKL